MTLLVLSWPLLWEFTENLNRSAFTATWTGVRARRIKMAGWHTDLLYPFIALIPTLVYISKATCFGGMIAESDDLVG